MTTRAVQPLCNLIYNQYLATMCAVVGVYLLSFRSFPPPFGRLSIREVTYRDTVARDPLPFEGSSTHEYLSPGYLVSVALSPGSLGPLVARVRFSSPTESISREPCVQKRSAEIPRSHTSATVNTSEHLEETVHVLICDQNLKYFSFTIRGGIFRLKSQ